MSKVGFVGLGIMGAPMAGHLLAAGHALSVFTRGKVPESLTAGGAKVCANAREVAQSAGIDPGFRIELHQKDLNLALSTARKIGVSLPNTATCQELFNACAAHGGKACDHSAMVRALKTMANFEIGQPAPGR